MPEIWDVYDKNRIKTGRTMVRGNPIKKGDYHLVVHICIFNSKGEMLIQKRTLNKEVHPGKWDITVGGSALLNETSQEAIERETMEEIGLQLDFKNERPYLTTNFKEGFDDIYLIKKDIDIEKLVLQKEEVSAVKWATLEEILELIEKKEFKFYNENLIKYLFDCIN